MSQVLLYPPVDEEILSNLGTAARMAHLPMHQAVLLSQDAGIAVDFIAAVIDGTYETFLSTVEWETLRHRMRNNIDAGNY